MKAACATCVHAAPEKRMRLAHMQAVTVCRRRSPSTAGWPEVRPEDVCGEHVAKDSMDAAESRAFFMRLFGLRPIRKPGD